MNDDDMRELLGRSKTIAVVGFSAQTHKPSFFVSKYMQSQGYRILPINPALAGRPSGLMGEIAYPDIDAARQATGLEIDIVNVFRRAEHTPLVAKQAVHAKAGVLWLQQGIVSEEAAKIASNAGLQVIMDLCLKLEHQRLM
ncbi:MULTISPECIES: CoA-binding protein [Limnobacter]|uniref:CoA-binding protein n=1 Tax=Limnobacter litoralis TaxID=481366 RepID=A0ABQ5YQY5_9BURK|nr:MULTISPECIES: CoA-binding protein [Limnobacter]GLR25333.1 CoA-binding protein [Limnobacter litoralis]HEX5485500.1 CoA-binding protein [Limnobacter sp.]